MEQRERALFDRNIGEGEGEGEGGGGSLTALQIVNSFLLFSLWEYATDGVVSGEEDKDRREGREVIAVERKVVAISFLFLLP